MLMTGWIDYQQRLQRSQCSLERIQSANRVGQPLAMVVLTHLPVVPNQTAFQL